MTRGAWLLGLVLAACAGGPGVAERREPPPRVDDGAREASPARVPEACATRPAALSSYDAITDGVPFSLEIRRDDHGAWLPTSPLRMPMHHASMISWTDDTHLLDAHPSREPIVVIATGLGRVSIEHDETHNVFFATYGARVERVCPALVD